MTKALLNEAESFLLKNWAEARMLEESMEGVRAKYKELVQRVIQAVTDAHPELNSGFAYPTQFWGSGSIGFGRKSWPAGDSGWPPGLWIWNLRLENLASEDSEPPYASIWVSSKSAKKCNLDMTAARTQLKAVAKELLSPEDLDQTSNGGEGDVLLDFTSPSKIELIGLLLDEDGQKFVDRLVKQFDIMSGFIPTLDKLFGYVP